MRITTYSVCHSRLVSQRGDISRRAKRDCFSGRRTGGCGRSSGMACEACNAKFNLFKRKVSERPRRRIWCFFLAEQSSPKGDVTIRQISMSSCLYQDDNEFEYPSNCHANIIVQVSSSIRCALNYFEINIWPFPPPLGNLECFLSIHYLIHYLLLEDTGGSGLDFLVEPKSWFLIRKSWIWCLACIFISLCNF